MFKYLTIVIASTAMLVTPACNGGSGSNDSDTAEDIAPDTGDGADTETGADPDAGTETGADTDIGADMDIEADADIGADTDTEFCDQVRSWVEAYKAAHPGNGGKDWDINAKTPAEIAADPAAQQLLSLCGDDQRPVFPLLAWEYGGADHPWINPEASALVYCVYIPVSPSSTNWQYDPALDHVTADVYVKCPDQNPCNDRTGANQVIDCIGDATNFEILVDIASLHDGADAGLSLAEASTELRLVLADGTKVHLYSAM
jgi:hypothetical protein